MKKISTLLISMFFIGQLLSQAPQKMSYQAVIRNGNSELVTNQNIGMRISILQGSPTGTVIYQETYSPIPQTNGDGLLTMEIGGGSALIGTFSSIDWSSGPYFLKTENDLTGGSNYTISGISQLLSVPYAMYSESAGTANETDPIFVTHPSNGISATNITDWSSTYWSELSNVPVGFSDGVDNDTWVQNSKTVAGVVSAGGLNFNKLWKTDATGNPAWSSLSASEIPDIDWNKVTSGKPVTLAGYGITDGMNISHVANGITSSFIDSWNLAYSWGDHALAGYARYPVQTGNSGKVLSTDGSSPNWITPITSSDLIVKVSKAGDNMTGALTINNVTDRTALVLNSNSHTELRMQGLASNIPAIFIGTTATGPLAEDAIIQFYDINYGASSRLAFHLTPSYNVLNLLSNGKVGIGNNNPSTTLDVSGVITASGGFLPPRMTKAQRSALTPVEGLVIYNSETKKLNFYDGASWKTFDGSSID